MLGQSVQSAAPEGSIIGEPLVGIEEGRRVEADNLEAAAALAGDEFGGLEDLEVLGDGGKRERVGSGEVAHGFGPGGDIAEESAAGGIGERVEDGIESCGVRFNHMVECSVKRADCQPFG